MADFQVIYDLLVRDRTSRALNKVTGKVQRLERPLNRVNQALIKLGAGLGAAAIGAFVTSAVKMVATTEAMNTAILLSASTAKIGATNMAFLNSTIESLRLDSASAREGFKTLAGSFQNTKLEGAEMRRIFLSVSKASKVMGLSADQQKGTFVALGQIMSKGKVQAEELRGQLGERIPGAFQIAARAMGLTTKALDKQLSLGKVMSEDFLPKFATELEKTFGPKLKGTTDSLQGSLNVVNNAFRKVKKVVGNFAAPAVKAFARVVERAQGINSGFSKTFADQATLAIKNRIELNANLNLLKKVSITEEKRKGIIKDVNVELKKLNLTTINSQTGLAELNRLQKESNVLLLQQAVAAKRREGIAELIEEQATNLIEITRLQVEVDTRRAKVLTDVRTKEAEIAASGLKATKGTELRLKAGELLAKNLISAATAATVLEGADISGLATGFTFGTLKAAREIQFFQGQIGRLSKANKGITSDLTQQQKLTDEVLKNFTEQKAAASAVDALVAGTSGVTPAGASLSGQADRIRGSAPRNITINIENLIRDFEINTATLTEGSEEIKTVIIETILTAVNDVNIIAD